MKKLCFGSFVTVLKHCMAASVSQKQLCRTILLSVASSNYDATIDDTLISNLVRCERNVAAEVSTPATTADVTGVAEYFQKSVIPLLDGNKTALIILALKDIISDDNSIDGKTLVEKVSSISKEDLLIQTEIALSDFLAGIFLYTVINVKNTDGKASISGITLDYINSFEPNRDTVAFILTSKKLDTEFADELLPDLTKLRNMLAKLPHPQTLIPPDEISIDELPYITALLEAYADAEGLNVLTKDELVAYRKYKTNFERQRKDYYAAESVRRNTMEVFSGLEEDQFETLKTETHDGIIDVHSQDFDNGFARLNAVMSQASVITISKCLLIRETDWIGNSEKKGVWHFLVNDGRLKWVAEDE